SSRGTRDRSTPAGRARAPKGADGAREGTRAEGRAPREGAPRPLDARLPPRAPAGRRQREHERDAEPRQRGAPAEVRVAPGEREARLEEVQRELAREPGRERQRHRARSTDTLAPVGHPDGPLSSAALGRTKSFTSTVALSRASGSGRPSCTRRASSRPVPGSLPGET